MQQDLAKSRSLILQLVKTAILTGCEQGETVFVPQISLIPYDLSFEFK